MDVLSEHPSEEENTDTDFGGTSGTDFMKETLESQHLSIGGLKRHTSDQQSYQRSSVVQGFGDGNGGNSRLIRKQ